MIPFDYVNEDGFVTLEANAPTVPGEGNGWMVTGVAFLAGLYLPTPSGYEMLRKCRFSFTDPRIWRSPWKRNEGDEEKCDDYWGALPLSQAWAKEIRAYIKYEGANFNPKNTWSIRFWFARFIPFLPFVALCAGESNWFHHFVLSVVIRFDGFFNGRSDGNMKAFCRMAKARREGRCLSAGRYWVRRAKKKYGTVGKSWAGYLPEGHPLLSYDE